MVTAVKYRKILLNKEVENCIKETMKGISERYEIAIDEIGFDQNHIHIFCGSKPSKSPMEIITIIKSITARKVFEQFPELKKKGSSPNQVGKIYINLSNFFKRAG